MESMKRIIANFAVAGIMTLAAHARAGEVAAMETPNVQGRVFISVGDFQKVLRGSQRILSSENGAMSSVTAQDAQDDHSSMAALKDMSADDKASLYKKVLPLAKKEARALTTAINALNTQLAQIKAERKTLQAARMNQGPTPNPALQSRLFSNLLEESNLEAKIAEAKRQIQESHILVVEFSKSGRETVLVKVQHGSKSLWSKPAANLNAETIIAQN